MVRYGYIWLYIVIYGYIWLSPIKPSSPSYVSLSYPLGVPPCILADPCPSCLATLRLHVFRHCSAHFRSTRGCVRSCLGRRYRHGHARGIQLMCSTKLDHYGITLDNFYRPKSKIKQRVHRVVPWACSSTEWVFLDELHKRHNMQRKRCCYDLLCRFP